METKVLCFSIDTYNRRDLDEMTDSEKYELACAAASVGYNEASVLSLKDFQEMANDELICLDGIWIYFVNV